MNPEANRLHRAANVVRAKHGWSPLSKEEARRRAELPTLQTTQEPQGSEATKMEQTLKPGELPISGPQDSLAAQQANALRSIRHNLRLRQQRGGGFGYLTDAEAEYVLRAAGA